MDFHKVETTSNFSFSTSLGGQIRVTDFGSSVFQLTLENLDRWPRGTDSQAALDPSEFNPQRSRAQCTVGPGGEVSLLWEGRPVLSSVPGRGLGVCGPKWALAFHYDPDDRFYGMGEKHLGFELSRKRTKFWNTDEFGDFPMAVIEAAQADPSYSSFPVLLVKHSGLWAAILVNNPHCVFFNTGAEEPIFQPGTQPFLPELFLGARDGALDVWIVAGASPSEVVRKVQTLQGRTPLPPVWALGHHQCRWGYRGCRDLELIAEGFAKHGIPNDGLWLDIEYMDGYRVFTTDPHQFDDVASEVAALKDRGHRVIPILDPGLRQDTHYSVYARAVEADVLCQTPEGNPYVGYVWPGYTVFPDFSLPEARDFWAQEVKSFTDNGFGGYWIDMNDPSTGSVPLDDMRFGHGARPHSAYHNQYALGMAEATRTGIQASRPNERPFIVSRSAFLSSARYTALWTGDNVASETHMAATIALSLNLSVSGMPFNGPDVPGFAQDASNQLMRAWYKLGFLFPFLRNHKVLKAASQEPWSRDRLTTRVVGNYIRLRYKLLPYLYQTFVTQNSAGDPILRPLWYHDPDSRFDKTEDQFFVGSSVLQAPFLHLKDHKREVVLPLHPSGDDWFDVDHLKFVSAGQITQHRHGEDTTPIFLASPSVIPLQRGIRKTNQNDLSRIDLLVITRDGGPARLDYQFDDGVSEGWRQGAVSRFRISVTSAEGQARVDATTLEVGYGNLKVRFLVLSSIQVKTLVFNRCTYPLVTERVHFAGRVLRVSASEEMTLGEPN